MILRFLRSWLSLRVSIKIYERNISWYNCLSLERDIITVIPILYKLFNSVLIHCYYRGRYPRVQIVLHMIRSAYNYVKLVQWVYLAWDGTCVLIPHSRFLHLTLRISPLGHSEGLKVKMVLSTGFSLYDRV